MTTNKDVPRSPKRASKGLARTMIGGAVQILVAVGVLLAAAAVYQRQIETSPRAGRQKPPARARLVRVAPVRKDRCMTTVSAMGPVMPAQQVALRPQVTGQIVEISEDIIPGGHVTAGQRLFAVDDRDYHVLVEQRQADVARALRDLKIEQGNQAVARTEYELLGEVVMEEDRELVLREPQLASAKAAYDSAAAALRRAQLDLERCEIKAPFNAIVQQKYVDLGATVSLNTNLVGLIGTDEAWVELKVWLNDLKWIVIPQTNGHAGSSVTISSPLAWGSRGQRQGRVLRLAGELEPQGRLARLLVGIDDPFCLKPENRDLPRVLVDSLVSAEIQGRALESVFAIERPHVRENDNTVWIMNDADQLEIRPIEILFGDATHVYVSDGLTEGERLVVTDIAAPVAGMALRLANAPGQAPNTAMEGGY